MKEKMLAGMLGKVSYANSNLNETHSKIFSKIMEAFPLIDAVLGDHLKLFIVKFQTYMDDNKPRILQKALKACTMPLEVNKLPRTDMIRIIYEATALRIMESLPEAQPLALTSIKAFQDAYSEHGEINDLEENELRRLLDFRNMMRVALLVIPPKLEHLLNLVVRKLIFTHELS